MTMNERTRRVVRALVVATAVLALAGAGAAGLAFGDQTMDLVLLQLVFYGAWACLVGAFVGGTLGAQIEEDACGELDMGTMASMGGILGTLATGLVGTALTGLAFVWPWQAVFVGAVALAGLHFAAWRLWPWHIVRAPNLDERGCLCDAAGRPLPDDQQPLRMRDRLAILLAVSVVVMLALTLAMALLMGSDLGHPVMMAPMMYGMFGTMVGGMLGGWLAGLLDEHRGPIEHENPVMVGAMALMAGMMGGMPSGMIGGMMAVMGARAIGLTVAAGVLLLGLLWLVAVRGRYRLERGSAAGPVSEAVGGTRPAGSLTAGIGSAPNAVEVVAGGSVVVRGMTCGACVAKVQRKVGGLPGVGGVQVDLATGLVTLQWGHEFGGLDRVRLAIEELGYEVAP
jgi:copper chaperone